MGGLIAKPARQRGTQENRQLKARERGPKLQAWENYNNSRDKAEGNQWDGKRECANRRQGLEDLEAFSSKVITLKHDGERKHALNQYYPNGSDLIDRFLSE